MATLICNSDANFTDSNVWDVVDTTSFLNSEAGTQAITTSNLDSATFTPGAITVKGIALKVSVRLTSVSGTMTVTLRNSTDSTDVTSVTVNNSDIAAAITNTMTVSWHYFKFSSSQLLTAGKAYLVRVTSSVTSQVFLYRNATTNNFSRMLPTTTTATIAAADAFHVLGELTGQGTGNDRTITMDSTATTAYGNTTNASSVGHRGTLTWATTAATNFILRHAGILEIGAGGTYNQGTVATPCPRDSSMDLQFVSTSTTPNCYLTRRGGTVVMQGQSRTSAKTAVVCSLSSDLAAAGTTVNVDTDTGWLDGDEVCIAPTARTAAEGEKRVLSGGAGASSFTITAGVTNAHSASRLFACKIGLLTRNVKMTNVDTTKYTCFLSTGATGSVDVDYVQFKNCGGASVLFSAFYTTSNVTQEFDYCSFMDIGYTSVYVDTTAGGVAVRNSVFWNVGILGNSTWATFRNVSTTSGANSIFSSNLLVCGSTAVLGIASGQSISLSTVTSNYVYGFATGFNMTTNASAKGASFSIDSNVCAVCAVGFDLGLTNIVPFVIEGIKVYHCTSVGIQLTGSKNLVFNNLESHGNTTTGVLLSSGNTSVGSRSRFNGLLTGSTTGFTQVNGVSSGTMSVFDTVLNDTVFSATGGGKAPSTNEVIFPTPTFGHLCEIKFANATKQSIAISSTTAPGTAAWDQQSYISFSRINGTSDGTGDYTVMSLGTLEYDSSVYHTATPSLKMTSLLGTSTQKMQSASIGRRQRIKVASGATSTAAVWVRTSAAYNGNQPRLMVAANAAAGIENDTALDTMTVGTATWEELTGTTAAVADDCELEFYVDCDGTAGYVNVDDWTIDSATNDCSVWVDGLPTTQMVSAGGGVTGVARSRLFDKKG